jgi:hypothetical protein
MIPASLYFCHMIVTKNEYEDAILHGNYISSAILNHIVLKHKIHQFNVEYHTIL